MIVGIIVLWAGYSAGLWGYCLIRGYCVTPANLLSWGFPKSKAAPQAAPPAKVPAPAPSTGGAGGGGTPRPV